MKKVCISALALSALAAGLALAAPIKKERDEKLPPISEEQLTASENNLKQIGLAIHNYHDVNGAMPTNVLSKDGKPLLSWRVQILPYIEADNLYKQFKMDEPWDSDHNKKLIDSMPSLFAPVRGKYDAGLTFYQSFTGKHGWCNPGAKIPTAFPDGTSNTLMVAEGGKPVIWTKPVDLEFDGKKLPELGGQFDGRFHAAMADGSASLFKKGLDKDVLSRLIDPNDGQTVDVNRARDKEGKE